MCTLVALEVAAFSPCDRLEHLRNDFYGSVRLLRRRGHADGQENRFHIDRANPRKAQGLRIHLLFSPFAIM